MIAMPSCLPQAAQLIVSLTCLSLICGCSSEDRRQEEASPASSKSTENNATAPAPIPALPPESAVQQMQMQLVLDHPQVRPYLHLEIPENLPLAVHAAAELSQGVASLNVGGHPVRVVDAGIARLRFTRREQLEGPRARVHFDIPPEGVVGHVDLELTDYLWHAVDASVVEQ